MTTVDTSIYRNLLAAPKSVEDYNREAAEDQAGQLRNAFARTAYSEQQNALQRKAQVRGLVSSPGFDLGTAQSRQQLISADPDSGFAYIKDYNEGLRSRAQADSALFDAAAKKLNQHLMLAGQIQSPSDLVEWINTGLQAQVPGMTPERGKAIIAELEQNPQSLSQVLQKIQMGGVELEKQINLRSPKFERQDTGGAVQFVQTNALAGPVGLARNIKPLIKTTSPDTLANNAVTMRGQNLVNERARDANSIARDGNNIKGETDLRKEFADLPEVKNYKQASPAYAAIVDAAKRNTPQSDINLVYGIAKLYDPNSVVREGEYATVANSPAIPQRIKGYAQYLAGGGRLTPAVKAQIVAEAESRIKTYSSEYDNAKRGYEGVAKKRGLSTDQVFTDIGGGPAGSTPGDIDAILKKHGVK